MKKNFLLFLITFTFHNSSSLQAQTIKGLYVDGFNTILGNTVSEDSLLNYAQYNGFNYLALYNLWPIHVTYNLTNAGTCTVLATFMQRAKQNFGIQQIGAVGENFFFFNNVIKVYNQQHTNPLQKFDVYNVEFEFWNTGTVSTGNYYCTTYLQPSGYTCDTAGAFHYYKRLLFQVDSLANTSGVLSETYVGWFNQGQAITIGNTVDRILLHDYISNYGSLYSYIQPRLQLIAGRNSLTSVIPIFSAEPSFMGPWLSTHTVVLPFTDLQTDLANETGSWKNFINLAGYQWFAYSFMPYNVVATAISTLNTDELNVYPNPVSDYLKIKASGNSVVKVEVSNSIGQKVLTTEFHSNKEMSINLSELEKGIYFCSVITETDVTIRKIIKQ